MDGSVVSGARLNIATGIVLLVIVPAAAQQPSGSAQDHAQHEGHSATHAELFSPRDASGTSWLPDLTPMYGAHRQHGDWQLMLHGSAYAQFLYEAGDRGDEQGGSINWGMVMARRPIAGGRLGLRGMLSLEPWTIPGCGYPDLLASGETCEGEPIHDRQHPHDLFMELAAEYDHPLRGSTRWQIYGGAAAEPALGPVAFPHRTSSMPNPLAPVTHHWLDATHISFGVVTGAIYDRKWKAEASAFNGREPDSDRLGLDLDALDSFSGRFWWLPTERVAMQISAGRLKEAEQDHDGGPDRIDVRRLTASATYHRPLGSDGVWASTIAWGRNTELSESTDALLVETSLDDGRDSWFGRFEVVEKPADALDIHGTAEVLTVGKVQLGYVRYLGSWRGMNPGFGGGASLAFVPSTAEPFYGQRVSPGLAVFATLRPARHRM